jgi:hypothetical protein
VSTLWTDFLKKHIFAAVRRENARSVRKVTDFVDRHYIIDAFPKQKFWEKLNTYGVKTNGG